MTICMILSSNLNNDADNDDDVDDYDDDSSRKLTLLSTC